MPSFHLSIKNGKKGKAASHSEYIAREGRFGRNGKRDDLQFHQYDNLPSWADGQPSVFWNAADKFERANGTAYVELEFALPVELAPEQRSELVQEFAAKICGSKPYEFAIHAPEAALGKVSQPHAHLMINNRVPDTIERSPELHFRRHNPVNPELGGCKKDSGGRHRGEMKELAISIRETFANIQNQYLEKYGHTDRVDHRSYRTRGIDKAPERHLGHARIKQMSEEAVGELLQKRRS